MATRIVSGLVRGKRERFTPGGGDARPIFYLWYRHLRYWLHRTGHKFLTVPTDKYGWPHGRHAARTCLLRRER